MEPWVQYPYVWNKEDESRIWSQERIDIGYVPIRRSEVHRIWSQERIEVHRIWSYKE